MENQTIEQEIKAKGLMAPRVTPADIEANIASEHYFTAADGVRASAHDDFVAASADMPGHPLGLLTFCVLVLNNGFTVTGESACASPRNFDAALGRKIARQNAVAKIWPLMGYELRSRLATAPKDDSAILRQALVGMVGFSSADDLRRVEVQISTCEQQDDEKDIALAAVRALIATAKD